MIPLTALITGLKISTVQELTVDSSQLTFVPTSNSRHLRDTKTMPDQI